MASARQELERKDEALRRYKEIHMGKLPEQLHTNLATMSMLQRELQTVEESLLFARERQQSARTRARFGSVGPGTDRPPPAGELADLAPPARVHARPYKEGTRTCERLRSRIARMEARAAEAARRDASRRGPPGVDPTRSGPDQLAKNEIRPSGGQAAGPGGAHRQPSA